ncbi:MAG: radical SAM protein [Candidatus Methylarchaceae archaeon HK02M2]|nr:radical SAM protein [Candidatus Methylarchaceae archaeon HK02M2]
MSIEPREVKLHPCFNEKAHINVARAHLPVAPKCNIQCNYCSRYIDPFEVRPGVSSKILKPKEALDYLGIVIEEFKELKVVGIAGPGEPLFNEETFETLKLVREKYPILYLCVASNGLLLPNKIEELESIGVEFLTITINAIDPEIGSKIYSFIYYKNKIIKGLNAAEILISNQIKGVELAVKRGMKIKVNTVLIPGINDHHIIDVAKKIKELGAYVQNIIPLIPIGKFKGRRPPTCDELQSIREKCEKIVKEFRLCKMCRADAVGIPGREVGFQERQYKNSEYFHA